MNYEHLACLIVGEIVCIGICITSLFALCYMQVKQMQRNETHLLKIQKVLDGQPIVAAVNNIQHRLVDVEHTITQTAQMVEGMQNPVCPTKRQSKPIRRPDQSDNSTNPANAVNERHCHPNFAYPKQDQGSSPKYNSHFWGI